MAKSVLELIFQGKDVSGAAFASVKRRITDLRRSLSGGAGGGFMDILEGKALGRDFKQLITGAMEAAASGKIKGITGEQKAAADAASAAFDKMDQSIKKITLSLMSFALPALEKFAHFIDMISKGAQGNFTEKLVEQVSDPRAALAANQAALAKINHDIKGIVWDPMGERSRQMKMQRDVIAMNVAFLQADMERQLKAQSAHSLGRYLQGGASGIANVMRQGLGLMPQGSIADVMRVQQQNMLGRFGNLDWWKAWGQGKKPEAVNPRETLNQVLLGFKDIFAPFVGAVDAARKKASEPVSGMAAREGRFLTIGVGDPLQSIAKETKREADLVQRIVQPITNMAAGIAALVAKPQPAVENI